MSLDAGLVVIGRNEARHLENALPKVREQFDLIVYVDSGSTDGSQAIAEENGAVVVALDTSQGFTAARARNAGLAKVQELQPELKYIQFIDGDCELLPSFVSKATEWLEAHDKCAIVCGRRVERHPEASVYNLLCDIEWDTPVGDAKYCGGDALMRVTSLVQVSGYNPHLIAGEEPELCVRLAAEGWGIYRIDEDMTLHDAAMTKFSQWWKRNVRSGHAFAEGSHIHGSGPSQHWAKETRSNWIWGGYFVAVLLLSIAISPYFLFALILFPVLAVKIFAKYPWPRPRPSAHRLWFGANCALGKVPQFFGQLQFLFNRLSGKQSSIIEYK